MAVRIEMRNGRPCWIGSRQEILHKLKVGGFRLDYPLKREDATGLNWCFVPANKDKV